MVKIGRGGHLRLTTNSSAKAGVGRGLFVDFGTAVTLAPGTANQMTIQTTDDALNQTHVLAVSAEVGVGVGQDDFDFFNMLTGEIREDVNLVIRVFFSFTDGSDDSLLIRLRPTAGSDQDLGAGRNCPSSDSVTVTDLGTDSVTGLHTWTVVTNPVDFGACISRSGECEFGETDDTGETCLLSDVDDADRPGSYRVELRLHSHRGAVNVEQVGVVANVPSIRTIPLTAALSIPPIPPMCATAPACSRWARVISRN